jgi:hypothetical protein
MSFVNVELQAAESVSPIQEKHTAVTEIRHGTKIK